MTREKEISEGSDSETESDRLLAHLTNILSEEEMAKKADDGWKKRDLRCHAVLCGREMSLKADGVVAGYLADSLFNPSNDTSSLV